MANVPASIRNNNPGAMQPGPSSQKFGSTAHQVLNWTDANGIKQTNTCATFDDPVQGAAAMFDLLASKGYVGKTISQAIAKWCGGFWVSDYIKLLEAGGMVTRDTPLTRELLMNSDVAIPLAKSMALQEAGREFPLDTQDWLAAHALAFGGTIAPAAPAVATQANGTGAATPVAAPPAASPGAPPAPAILVTAPAAPLTRSGTIWASVLAGVGTLMTNMEELVKFGMEWVAAVGTLKPIQGLLGELAGNPKAMATSVTSFGLSMIITRRIKAKLEGKKG